jgi:hypothetical protein
VSWFACHRSESTFALLREHPKAFCLLAMIAARARFAENPCTVTKLTYGQCFIGDWKECGQGSYKAYRISKQTLTNMGFCSFLGQTRGTIATLLPRDEESTIYSISNNRLGQSEGQAEGQSRGKRGANEGPLKNNETRKQGNKEDEDEEKIIILPPKFTEVESFAKSQPMAIPQECTEAFFDEMEALQWTYKGIGCVAKTAWQARFRRYTTNWINNANSPNRNFR